MAKKKETAQVIPGVGVAEYQAWLLDPITQAVFTYLEANARPQMLTNEASAESASYRLGIVTGYWSGLDASRVLIQEMPQDDLPDPTYT